MIVGIIGTGTIIGIGGSTILVNTIPETVISTSISDVNSPTVIYYEGGTITIKSTSTSSYILNEPNPIDLSERYSVKSGYKDFLSWHNKMLSKNNSKKLHKKVNRHYINVRNRI